MRFPVELSTIRPLPKVGTLKKPTRAASGILRGSGRQSRWLGCGRGEQHMGSRSGRERLWRIGRLETRLRRFRLRNDACMSTALATLT
jgi:hypothetical protein